MLRNYLKIALRNLFRHKAYSFINIAGLAIGMASSIIIFLWVQHERSFDRFHTKADSIYRIIGRAGDFDFAVNPAGMPEGLQAELPAIRSTVRVSHPQSATLAVGDKKFEEKRYSSSTLHSSAFLIFGCSKAMQTRHCNEVMLLYSPDLLQRNTLEQRIPWGRCCVGIIKKTWW